MLSFLFLFFVTPASADLYQVCPTVQFTSKPPFTFTEDEKRILCGEKNETGRAWSVIPPAQAQLHMTAMLQIRGYHQAKFDLRADGLIVDLGQPTIIKQIYVDGAPPVLDINRKRRIKGEKLTPEKLDELRDWIIFELKHFGYPCPDAKVEADYIKGGILVTVIPGPHLLIKSVGGEQVGDLHDNVLRRFDAFQVGEPFDSWNVVISERRAVDSNTVIGTHFNTTCTPTGVDLYQTVQPGLPRLFRAGVGFDTEEGPLFKLATQYTRMNKRGSSLENTLTSSLRIQDFTSTFNWYVFRNLTRPYLKPTVMVRRDKEEKFEFLQSKVSFLAATTYDDSFNHWEFTLGPTFESNKTVVGIGPGDARSLYLNQTIQLTSHAFEYFRGAPQMGYRVGMESSFANKEFASTVTAYKIVFFGETLMNVGMFSPPNLILGLRGAIGTTLTPNGSSDAATLPQSMKFFLGGNQDLRGFFRKELPANNGLGALTEAFLGFEGRFPDLLPWGLQPVAFVDAGMLGTQPAQLEWPLYWSPGLGMRLASAIGVFRAELAHGFVHYPGGYVPPFLEHLQFYFSYGEEF